MANKGRLNGSMKWVVIMIFVAGLLSGAWASNVVLERRIDKVETGYAVIIEKLNAIIVDIQEIKDK